MYVSKTSRTMELKAWSSRVGAQTSHVSSFSWVPRLSGLTRSLYAPSRRRIRPAAAKSRRLRLPAAHYVCTFQQMGGHDRTVSDIVHVASVSFSQISAVTTAPVRARTYCTLATLHPRHTSRMLVTLSSERPGDLRHDGDADLLRAYSIRTALRRDGLSSTRHD